MPCLANSESASTETLDRLVTRAKSGHREALESLFALTRDDVSRFISGRVTSEWVEDLTQETFSRALLGLPRYAGRSSVRSWLFSVARHTVADRYRSHARTPRTEYSPTVEEMYSLSEAGRFDEFLALRSLLDQLPEDRRRAFVLARVEGLSYAEIADLLDVPLGTVRSRVWRARRDLTRMLRAAE